MKQKKNKDDWGDEFKELIDGTTRKYESKTKMKNYERQNEERIKF